MGRAKIERNVLRPKGKINTTYLKRKDGLKNKAAEIGQMCGCEVALIVFPPKGCDNDEVIDLSVYGTMDEILLKYQIYKQQNPRRQQSDYLDPQRQSNNIDSHVQQSTERNDYAPSASSSLQIQQPIPEMNGYAYMNPNAQPSEQGIRQQMPSYVAQPDLQSMPQSMPQRMYQGMQHNMQYGSKQGIMQYDMQPGMQYGIQQGNMQHGMPHNNLVSQHHNFQEHNNHVQPQQGHGTSYMPSAMGQDQSQGTFTMNDQHDMNITLPPHSIQAPDI